MGFRFALCSECLTTYGALRFDAGVRYRSTSCRCVRWCGLMSILVAS